MLSAEAGSARAPELRASPLTDKKRRESERERPVKSMSNVCRVCRARGAEWSWGVGEI